MRLALACALALFATALPAPAEDRPSEPPYATPGEIPSPNPDSRVGSHKLVLILDHELNTRLVNLDEGQIVAWISYSPMPSTVIFEREVARNMICHQLVNFAIKDDEVRSAPIHAGEFASFCQLKPGRYKYKVVRTDPADHVEGTRRLEGEIIVGKPAQ